MRLLINLLTANRTLTGVEIGKMFQKNVELVPTQTEHLLFRRRMLQLTQYVLVAVNCVADYPLDVVFNLDMNGVVGFDGIDAPYVFGSYNNWDNFQINLCCQMLTEMDLFRYCNWLHV